MERDDYMTARKQLLADTLKCLSKFWRVSHLGDVSGSAIVAGGFPNTDWYYICDNGGEFNVGRVNHDEEMRSIPYTDGPYRLLDAGTMAYRIGCVRNGDEIDYSFRLPEIVEDIRGETSALMAA